MGSPGEQLPKGVSFLMAAPPHTRPEGPRRALGEHTSSDFWEVLNPGDPPFQSRLTLQAVAVARASLQVGTVPDTPPLGLIPACGHSDVPGGYSLCMLPAI